MPDKIIKSGLNELTCPDCHVDNKGTYKPIVRHNDPMNAWEALRTICMLGSPDKERFRCMSCGCVFERG